MMHVYKLYSPSWWLYIIYLHCKVAIDIAEFYCKQCFLNQTSPWSSWWLASSQHYICQFSTWDHVCTGENHVSKLSGIFVFWRFLPNSQSYGEDFKRFVLGSLSHVTSIMKVNVWSRWLDLVILSIEPNQRITIWNRSWIATCSISRLMIIHAY